MQRLRLHHELQPAADGRMRLRPEPGDQRLRTDAQVDENVAANRFDHFYFGIEARFPLPGHPDPFGTDTDSDWLAKPGVGNLGTRQRDAHALAQVQLQAIGTLEPA